FLPFMLLVEGAEMTVVIFVLLSVTSEMAGVIAEAASGERRYDGPMGKSDRAFLIGLLSVLIRSEEHTSELQSRFDLVCRLLLYRPPPRRVLHSFPTRRSSDLFLPFMLLVEGAEMTVVIFVLLSVTSEMAGVIAEAASGERRYDGPMGKSDRAFLIGLLSVLI